MKGEMKGRSCHRSGAGVLLVSLLICFVVWSCDGCLEEERSLLLQLKNSMKYPNGSIPFLTDWQGERCCEWSRVDCSNSTSHVVALELSELWEMERGIWYPNVTIIAQFKELESLNMRSNNMGGSDTLQAFCRLNKLMTLDLAHNSMEDKIPRCLGNLHSLRYLDLSSNRLSGSITPSSFSAKLRHLVLSNNRLQGEMPPGNSTMENLVHLSLDRNEFTIPPNLSRAPSLVVLDMSNNRLSGDMSSWFQVIPYLAFFLLGGNPLGGSISRDICKIEYLQYLDLSNTSVEGTIPSCFATVPTWEKALRYYNPRLESILIEITTKGNWYNFTPFSGQWMTLVDLSMNKLAGAIPLELGNMAGVRALNLSHNLLEGPLPVSFQNMKNLESLDLSHNHLSGAIPQEFGELYSLGAFSVAFNNFSGEIPFHGQLGTFGESSYIGNPGLCGRPLKTSCSSSIPFDPNNKNRTEEEEGEEEYGILDNDSFFYLCTAISFVLGFWGSIAFSVSIEIGGKSSSQP